MEGGLGGMGTLGAGIKTKQRLIVLWLTVALLPNGDCLSCVHCSSESSSDCISSPSSHLECEPGDAFCMVIKEYIPSLQDDSDANSGDTAGQMVKLERMCSKTDSSPECTVSRGSGVARVQCRSYCNTTGCNTGISHFLGLSSHSSPCCSLSHFLFLFSSISLSNIFPRLALL